MSEPHEQAPDLSPQDCTRLRKQAHHLDPVVRVGAQGITDGVVEAVNQALERHELIKVRIKDPENKQEMAEELAQRSGAALCGLVGHTVILFRPAADPASASSKT